MKTLMIVDSHNLCHAVKHNTKNLSFKGSKTGVIYGFLRYLLTIQEVVDADEWLFAWDPGINGTSVRKQIDPEYKANHIEKSAEDKHLNDIALPQFDIIRDEVLPALGFVNTVRVDGYEADDIIAQAAITLTSFKRVIVSRDQDLYQLLDDGVSIYNPIRKEYYSATLFRAEWGLHNPADWAAIKAIAGCSGDNVKGVKGVAEKTAIRYWNGLLKPGNKAYDAIEAAGEQIMANWDLVALPQPNMPDCIKTIGHSCFQLSKFSNVAARYGMKSLLQQPDRWKAAFCKGAFCKGD